MRPTPHPQVPNPPSLVVEGVERRARLVHLLELVELLRHLAHRLVVGGLAPLSHQLGHRRRKLRRQEEYVLPRTDRAGLGARGTGGRGEGQKKAGRRT